MRKINEGETKKAVIWLVQLQRKTKAKEKRKETERRKDTDRLVEGAKRRVLKTHKKNSVTWSQVISDQGFLSSRQVTQDLKDLSVVFDHSIG